MNKQFLIFPMVCAAFGGLARAGDDLMASVFPAGTRRENGQIIVHTEHEQRDAMAPKPIDHGDGAPKTVYYNGETVPFSDELLGARRLPNDALIIKCYRNGLENGTTIAFDANKVYYIAAMSNGVFNGKISLFPNETLSASAMVTNGVLNGTCITQFSPFKYKSKVKLICGNDHGEVAFGVKKDKWIEDGPDNLIIRAEGVYSDGRRYEGEFIQMKYDLDLWCVQILKYADFKEVSRSEPQVFHLSPYGVDIIKGK